MSLRRQVQGIIFGSGDCPNGLPVFARPRNLRGAARLEPPQTAVAIVCYGTGRAV